MNDRLTYLLIFIINIIVFFTAIFFYKKVWYKKNNQLLFKIFLYFTLYKILLHGVIVNFLRFLSNGKINKLFYVSTYEIFRTEFVEFISNIIYLTTFTLFAYFLTDHKSKTTNTFKWEIRVLKLLVFIYFIYLLLPTNIIAVYFWLFDSVFYYAGIISACLLLILCIKENNKLFLILSALCLALFFIKQIITGARGGIVIVSLTIIIFSSIILDRSKFKKLLIVTVLPIALLLILQNNLKEIKSAFAISYAAKEYDFNSASGFVNFIIDYSSNSLKKNVDPDKNSTFDEIEFRFGAASMFASGFYRFTDREGYVLFEPIKNSLYTFLPRQLFGDNKPFPSSFDGTEYGMGMYTCYREIDFFSYSMTDFYVSGHYFWEFGIFGVLLFSTLAAVYNILIIIISSKYYYYIGAVLLVLSFKPFWILPKLWISEIISMIPILILPFIILISILKFLTSLIKK